MTTVSIEVNVYAMGLVMASCCAPAAASREEVEQAVNRREPTGVASDWRIADDQTFKTGEPNPHPCEKDASRLHYLLSC